MDKKIEHLITYNYIMTISFAI